MGDKLAAKALMAEAGVPVLASLEVAADGRMDGAAAAALRFPVLVKAAAGGGGMRIVERSDDLSAAIISAQREAGAAFGDPRVFVERYVGGARHVEIQILADEAGTVIHAFERECSIQRRHQKIIEESPSSALDPTLRKAMTDAAVAAARAVGVPKRGDGGVRGRPRWIVLFLGGQHPAPGRAPGHRGGDRPGPRPRAAAHRRGSSGERHPGRSGARRHAIEARLYAEDPSVGFLPATGTVVAWQPDERNVRVDSGIETGSVVGVDWDPMLAKVIAHAPTRTEAALRLALALERAVTRGVTTNRDYLVATLRHPVFLAGDTTTAFVETAGVPRSRIPSAGERRFAAVAATLVDQRSRQATAGVLVSLPPGWRTRSCPRTGPAGASVTTSGASATRRSATARWR